MLEISETAVFVSEISKWIFFSHNYLLEQDSTYYIFFVFIATPSTKAASNVMECMFILVNGGCDVYMETWKPPS